MSKIVFKDGHTVPCRIIKSEREQEFFITDNSDIYRLYRYNERECVPSKSLREVYHYFDVSKRVLQKLSKITNYDFDTCWLSWETVYGVSHIEK